MSDPKIDAPRITKPIQLLAAWLIGLVLIDGSFLGAGVSIGNSWERSALVIASICNVPVFLLAIFVLQTKFRPELQEDVFYSKYINRKTNSQIEVNKIDVLVQKLGDIQSKLDLVNSSKIESQTAADVKQLDWSDWKVAINVQLPFFANLKKSLNDSGIPVFLAFGENKPLTDGYDISISDHMGSLHVIALLKAVLEFPFDRIAFWEPIREVGEDEDVYIGSYGENDQSIAWSESSRAAIARAEDALDLMRWRSQFSN